MRRTPLRPGCVVLAITVFLFLRAGSASADLRDYAITAPDEGHAVTFTSHAPLEDFKGRTNAVRGSLRFDPEDLDAGLELRIEVELAELDTGIGLRNRHMRENHLHTDKHPLAVFDEARLVGEPPAALATNAAVKLQVRGRFLLHGVADERTLEVEVRRLADGALAIASRFAVSLAKHEIPRPKFLVMKLADEQDLEIEIVARPKPGG